MELSRRGFLSSLAAAFILDPEKLLWKPGAKLISVPVPSVIEPGYSVADVVYAQLELVRPHLEVLFSRNMNYENLFPQRRRSYLPYHNLYGTE